MNKNNLMFNMFKQMKEGYKTKQDSLFEHAVRCWMDTEPADPFVEGSAASEYFNQMQRHYHVWRLKSADYRVNWKRLMESARKLCALNPRQPYKFDKEAEKQDMLEKQQKLEEQRKIDEQKAEEKRQLEEAAKAKLVVVEEPIEEVDYTNYAVAKKPNVIRVVPKTENTVVVSVDKHVEETPQRVFGVIPEKKQNVFTKLFGFIRKGRSQ